MIAKKEIRTCRENGMSWGKIGEKYCVNKGVIYKFFHSDNEKMDDHSKPRYVNRPLMPVWNIFLHFFNEWPHKILISYAYAISKKYMLRINIEACIDYLLDRWFGLTERQYRRWISKNKSYISKIIVSDIFRYAQKYQKYEYSYSD